VLEGTGVNRSHLKKGILRHIMKRLVLKWLSMTIFQSALPVRQSPTTLVLAIVEILRLVLG
jgi:hypothetical protein